MLKRIRPRTLFALMVLVALGAGVYFLLFAKPVGEARELRDFVHAQPPVAIVFTSRTEPASFVAPAPEAEGFTYPGTIPWSATEGRLRLLDTKGRVYELTWGRELPDGGTLIDVMSPSISLDGKRILFSGRKAAPDPGRWRIYSVNIDGSDLKQLTGNPDDPGCVAVPPMRYRADGTKIPDEERKRLDYDDIDPIDQGHSFLFASSRLPDLGRDHTRRATHIWVWPNGKTPRALTANRNNDRWPYITFAEQNIVFSLWSRNREAVTEDGTDIRLVSTEGKYGTGTADTWMAARILPPGIHFGYAVKAMEPVWRPRPLFNGRLAYMTSHPSGSGRLRLAQADWGYLETAATSLAAGTRLPNQSGVGSITHGPDRDGEGRELSAGCPSPVPGQKVVFSASPVGEAAGSFGLYLVADDWKGPQVPEKLFNDPRLVDADPVAVYARPMAVTEASPSQVAAGSRRSKPILASGKVHEGDTGEIHNSMIATSPEFFPRNYTDTGEVMAPPPPGIKSIALYAAHRDRFDDPTTPRVPGKWEKLLTAPLDEMGQLRTWAPADPSVPTVLAGLGADGKVFQWKGGKDKSGRYASFFAIAGDHYSGTRKDGYHYCLGCHVGHTYIPADITERTR